jgi:hypothetical protein
LWDVTDLLKLGHNTTGQLDAKVCCCPIAALHQYYFATALHNDEHFHYGNNQVMLNYIIFI